MSSSAIVSAPRTPLFKYVQIKGFKLGPQNEEFIDSLVHKLKAFNLAKLRLKKVIVLTKDKDLSDLKHSLKELEEKGINKVTFKPYPNIHYNSLL